VDVIDVAAKKVAASWPVDPASSPTGMALDTATHRLFVGGGKALVMMDATSGKVLSSVPICNGTDATWYDPGAKLAFVSCSEGKVTIARVSGDTMAVVQTLDTSRGSRTMTLDAGTHKIYLTAASPASGGGRGYDPNSFHVLVYGPK